MADYVIEIIGEHGNCLNQIEMPLDFDPTDTSYYEGYRTRSLIQDLIWEPGGRFHPIEGEPEYEGWYRFSINISPPGEMEEEE